MSKEIKKGFALVDSWGNLRILDEHMSEEIANKQREAFTDNLGLVVHVFIVEVNEDVWEDVKVMIKIDRKIEAWQRIITEGRVL